MAEIIESVRRHGDKALVRYAKAFDGVTLKRSRDRGAGGRDRARVRFRFQGGSPGAAPGGGAHQAVPSPSVGEELALQRPLGLELGQRISPVERAGAYVPGGKAAYPSTVLMTVIPAVAAGVREVMVTTPVQAEAALVLAAARVAGAHRVFRVGGAQAVAALAYGTETIPRVDKIVGPGNVYVAAAKRLVFGQVDIDSIAGPSEVLLLGGRVGRSRATWPRTCCPKRSTTSWRRRCA